MNLRNKLLFWVGAVSLVALAVYAANPSFADFNTNQFSGSGNKISIKSGASVTNTLVYDDLGHLQLRVTEDEVDVSESLGVGANAIAYASFANQYLLGTKAGDMAIMAGRGTNQIVFGNRSQTRPALIISTNNHVLSLYPIIVSSQKNPLPIVGGDDSISFATKMLDGTGTNNGFVVSSNGNVTAAGSLTVTGAVSALSDMAVDGALRARSFYGNGKGLTNTFRQEASVLDYGVIADFYRTSAWTTNGQNSFTVGSTVSSSDIGKLVYVLSEDTGVDFVAYVTGVTPPHIVTVAANLPLTLTNVTCGIGTSNTFILENAITQITADHKTVYFPPSNTNDPRCVTGMILVIPTNIAEHVCIHMPPGNVKLLGENREQCGIVVCGAWRLSGGVAYRGHGLGIDNMTEGSGRTTKWIENLTLDGGVGIGFSTNNFPENNITNGKGWDYVSHSSIVVSGAANQPSDIVLNHCTITKWRGEATKDAFCCTSDYFRTVTDNMFIDNNASAMNFSGNLVAERNQIFGCDEPLEFYQGNGYGHSSFSFNNVSNCLAAGAINGAETNRESTLDVVGNKFDAGARGLVAGAAGFLLSPAKHVTIRGNTFTNFASAVEITDSGYQSTTGETTKDVLIDGNILGTYSGVGLHGRVTGVTISHNSFHGSYTLASCYGSLTNVILTGNRSLIPTASLMADLTGPNRPFDAGDNINFVEGAAVNFATNTSAIVSYLGRWTSVFDTSNGTNTTGLNASGVPLNALMTIRAWSCCGALPVNIWPSNNVVMPGPITLYGDETATFIMQSDSKWHLYAMAAQTNLSVMGVLTVAGNLTGGGFTASLASSIRTNTAPNDFSAGWISALNTRTTNSLRRASLMLSLSQVDASGGVPIAKVTVESSVTNHFTFTVPGGLATTLTNSYMIPVPASAVVIVNDVSSGTGASVAIVNDSNAATTLIGQ